MAFFSELNSVPLLYICFIYTDTIYFAITVTKHYDQGSLQKNIFPKVCSFRIHDGEAKAW